MSPMHQIYPTNSSNIRQIHNSHLGFLFRILDINFARAKSMGAEVGSQQNQDGRLWMTWWSVAGKNRTWIIDLDFLFLSSIEEFVQQTMFDYRSSCFSIFGFAGYFATGVLESSRSTKVIFYASRYALGTCSAGAPLRQASVFFLLALSRSGWPCNPPWTQAETGRNLAKQSAGFQPQCG
jgi:hypothetical protein